MACSAVAAHFETVAAALAAAAAAASAASFCACKFASVGATDLVRTGAPVKDVSSRRCWDSRVMASQKPCAAVRV